MRKRPDEFLWRMMFWFIGGVILTIVVYFFYLIFNSLVTVLRGI